MQQRPSSRVRLGSGRGDAAMWLRWAVQPMRSQDPGGTGRFRELARGGSSGQQASENPTKRYR
jgi:hypothetical protein